jgi:hypothetical protein
MQRQHSQTHKLSASIPKLNAGIAKGFPQLKCSFFFVRSKSPLETSFYFACLRFFSALFGPFDKLLPNKPTA